MHLTKHYFYTGNTSKGFVNYYEGISAPWTERKRIYVLKGGPGIGMDTFMKLFGKMAREKGYTVEQFHSPSNSKMLDAVHIPSLGIAILDGIIPYMIEPILPGITEDIVNLGRFLDQKGLEHRKKDVLSLMEEIQSNYNRTYAYLEAAGKLQENTNYLYLNALCDEELRDEVHDLFGTHELTIGKHQGKMRHLFAEAYTPEGYINYFNTILEEETIICLQGPEVVASEYIKLAIHFSQFMGYGCEVYYSCLLPECPVHLLIKDLGLCITTNATFGKQIHKIVDLNAIIRPSNLERCKKTMQFNDEHKQQLVEASIDALKVVKELKSQLEEIYREYMDFTELTAFTNFFMKEILR